MVVVIRSAPTLLEGLIAAVMKGTPSTPTTEPVKVQSCTIILLPLVLNLSKFISFFTSSTVDPVAMCDASNSCVQSCVSLFGVETCGCLPGYELAPNGMNCTSTLKHSNN